MARLIASWNQPTQREPGGVPFDAAVELASSEVRISSDGGANWSAPAPVPPTDTQFIVENIALGTYTVELVHIDTGGRRSAPITAEGTRLGAPIGDGLTVVIEE